MIGPSDALLVAGCLVLAVLTCLVGELLGRGRAAATLSALPLLVAALAGFRLAWSVERPELVWGAFVVGGGYTTVVATVALLGALVVLVIGGTGDPRSGQRASLLCIAVIGAAAAASVTDLVALALSLEIAAVAGYALVAESRTARSAEASIKYLVQGVVATGLLVTGIAIIVGGFAPDATYGSVSRAATTGGVAVTVAILLVVATLAFKAAAAPFHAWSPDAYETAPPELTALLSGSVKLGVVAALSVFALSVPAGTTEPGDPFGAVAGVVLPVLGVLSIASVVVGSLAALRQRGYTRMLAYAGVAQVGYALMAAASGDAESALVAAVTYAVATTGAFLAAAAFYSARPEWDGTIEGLAGLGRSMPVLGVTVTVFMASLAGIPPLVGFWGKFQALQAAVRISLAMGSQEQPVYALWFAALAAVGFVGSVVAIAYYGAVLRSLLGPGARTRIQPDPGRFALLAAMTALAFLLVAAGIAPFVVPFATVLQGFVL